MGEKKKNNQNMVFLRKFSCVYSISLDIIKEAVKIVDKEVSGSVI